MRAWVYAEIGHDGRPAGDALGLLTKACSLTDDVAAVALGPGGAAVAPTLAAYGARLVFTDERAVHADFGAEPSAHVLALLAQEHEPDLVLFAGSYDSRDVAGRVQGILRATLVAGVDEIVDADHVCLTVALSLWPGRPGNLVGGIPGPKLVRVALSGPKPRLLLARSHAFAAVPSGGTAEVVEVAPEIPERCCRAHTVARQQSTDSGRVLEDARVVIGGGRGLGAPDGFDLLHELAEAVGGAAVGATRPVVDAGWAPYAVQIGQTGKTIAPDLYIAVGISGAAQHVVGVKARRVVAINADPAAPIFQRADLGVVADARTVVGALLRELETAGVG